MKKEIIIIIEKRFDNCSQSIMSHEEIKQFYREQINEFDKEICICAAIKLGDKIWRGHRHGNAWQAMREELSYDHTGKEVLDITCKNDIEEGFITSENRFVGREEGRKLQDDAGIKSASEDGYQANTLFSEDLYS